MFNISEFPQILAFQFLKCGLFNINTEESSIGLRNVWRLIYHGLLTTRQKPLVNLSNFILQDVAMALLFGIGYAGFIFEESLAINKSGVGLLMDVSLWVVRSIGAPSPDIDVSELTHASAEVGEIVFFLLGAMTIVDIVDAYQGFKLVTDNITTQKSRTVMWVVGFVTFFLSAILDNLTSTIVMVSLLRKLVPPSKFCKLLGAVIVIAANNGSAWTLISDVTTNMLWIHGFVSLSVPLALVSLTSEVNGKGQASPNVLASEQMAPRGQLVFFVAALVLPALLAALFQSSQVLLAALKNIAIGLKKRR
ncbi:Sodium:hydrogen antiporter 1 isoform 2 [Hibiscus syriacus]|uniref:Sodium:hydrogen antiporter 1 isoform 2 n=1 Tax=Hibiscus syriacus TaxID=106335 RepID=A0A6A3CYT5_HIBSY|nr:Sodium:hydrogen antiporter 1 isoform 2 [Hibiscus syriacus]